MEPPPPPPARCLAEDVLGDAGAASVVLQYLTPFEMTPLRELSRAVRDAIAAVPFGAPGARRDYPVGDSSNDDAVFRSPSWLDGHVVGPVALARWRACFPAARALTYCDEGSSEPLGEAELGLLSGFTTLRLSELGPASVASLDARVLGSVTSLALYECSLDDLRFLRHVSPRLAAVSLTHCYKRFSGEGGGGPDGSDDAGGASDDDSATGGSDADDADGDDDGPLPSFDSALAWLAHVPDVQLGIGEVWGQTVSDAGIARLVGARSLRLVFHELEAPLTGAGFAPLRALTSLRLKFVDCMPLLTKRFFENVAGQLRHLALDAQKASEDILFRVDDDLLTNFAGLASLELTAVADCGRLLCHAPATAPLERIAISNSIFTGRVLFEGALPSLRRLEVDGCSSFMAFAVPRRGVVTPVLQPLALEQLTVRRCSPFGERELAALAAACPRLRHVVVTGGPGEYEHAAGRKRKFSEADAVAAMQRHCGGGWRFTIDRRDQTFVWTASR
jgi:hypothetical protein